MSAMVVEEREVDCCESCGALTDLWACVHFDNGDPVEPAYICIACQDELHGELEAANR